MVAFDVVQVEVSVGRSLRFNAKELLAQYELDKSVS